MNRWLGCTSNGLETDFCVDPCKKGICSLQKKIENHSAYQKFDQFLKILAFEKCAICRHFDESFNTQNKKEIKKERSSLFRTFFFNFQIKVKRAHAGNFIRYEKRVRARLVCALCSRVLIDGLIIDIFFCFWFEFLADDMPLLQKKMEKDVMHENGKNKKCIKT